LYELIWFIIRKISSCVRPSKLVPLGRIRRISSSPAYFEKCIKDLKEAESFEKVLDHIPVSHRFFTAAWNALGARVVNDEFIFDENGNCGGSPNTYVTNSRASSDDSVEDEAPIKKGKRKKALPQQHYEKRKLMREQFEERLAEKAYLKEQLETGERHEELLKNSDLSKRQNASRFIERYEANILTS